MVPSKLNTQPLQKSIDFFSELSKIINNTPSSSESSNLVISSLASSSTSTSTSTSSSTSTSMSAPISPSMDDNICLISKEKLHPNHITLTCNHKFNYIPIYKEVLYQKTKSNTLYEVTQQTTTIYTIPIC
jgi:hypothetical protein